mmetsp:Transcript_17218/g.51577  ORF Transcript_17218/g.51577 Transcript_17218/m.51577 type:complete len:290 (-) Transcript_17218:543-1412(-)
MGTSNSGLCTMRPFGNSKNLCEAPMMRKSGRATESSWSGRFPRGAVSSATLRRLLSATYSTCFWRLAAAAAFLRSSSRCSRASRSCASACLVAACSWRRLPSSAFTLPSCTSISPSRRALFPSASATFRAWSARTSVYFSSSSFLKFFMIWTFSSSRHSQSSCFFSNSASVSLSRVSVSASSALTSCSSAWISSFSAVQAASSFSMVRQRSASLAAPALKPWPPGAEPPPPLGCRRWCSLWTGLPGPPASPSPSMLPRLPGRPAPLPALPALSWPRTGSSSSPSLSFPS